MLIKRALLSLLCVLCMTSISYAQQKLSTGGVTMGQSQQQVVAVLKNKGANYNEEYKGNKIKITVKKITVGGVLFDRAAFEFIDNKLCKVSYYQNETWGVDHPDFYNPNMFFPYPTAEAEADFNRRGYDKLLNGIIAKYGNPTTMSGSEATTKSITWHALNGVITIRYLYKKGYDHSLYPYSRTIKSGLWLVYEDSSLSYSDL